MLCSLLNGEALFNMKLVRCDCRDARLFHSLLWRFCSFISGEHMLHFFDIQCHVKGGPRGIFWCRSALVGVGWRVSLVLYIAWRSEWSKLCSVLS